MVVNSYMLNRLDFLQNENIGDVQKIDDQIRSIKKNFKRVVDDRFLTVVSALDGTVVYIYKGNKYKRIRLSYLFVGFKMGEFSFTRKPFKYPIKKKKKNFLRR